MFEYVCQHYGVPACLGREVMAYGQAGIIVKDLGTILAWPWWTTRVSRPGRTILSTVWCMAG